MSGDPVADEQSYTCPDSQAAESQLSSAETFVLTTLKIVDNTCLPAVLVCCTQVHKMYWQVSHDSRWEKIVSFYFNKYVLTY